MSLSIVRLFISIVLALCAVGECAYAQAWFPFRHRVFEDAQHNYLVLVPPGYVLCVGPPDSSASYGIKIPLRKGSECNSKDAIRMHAWFDSAFSYGDVRDHAADTCRSGDDPDPDPPFVIEEVGKLLGGMDTIVCTQVDEGLGEYLKKVLARLDRADITPIDYTIILSADLKDRAQADALLSQVIAGFKLDFSALKRN